MILMLMMIKMRDDDECDVGMQMYAGGHLRFFCQRWNQLPFQAFLPRDDDHDVWMVMFGWRLVMTITVFFFILI